MNDLDLSCAVNWCTTIPTDRRSGIYCSNHAKYKVKYGTPTPIVDCYGCASKIEAPKAFRGRFYCVECIVLLEKYSLSIPKIYQLSTYGLTSIDYIKMLVAQDFRCKMCDKEGRLVIDHDHNCCNNGPGKKRSCGKCVRGLICHKCNVFIGMYEANPEILVRMEKYLNG